MHYTFLYISLPSTAQLPVKMPNQSCFVKDVNKQWQNSFSSWTMADRNSAPEEFACIWQSKRFGITTIETEKKVNSFFHATFSWLSVIVVSFKNSLIFMQDVTDAGVNTCCKLKLEIIKYVEKLLLFACLEFFRTLCETVYKFQGSSFDDLIFFPTSWTAVFSQVWRRSIFKFCVSSWRKP